MKSLSILSSVSRTVRPHYGIPNSVEAEEARASCRNDPTSSYLRAPSCLARVVWRGGETGQKVGVSAGKRTNIEEGVSHPNSYAGWLKRSSLNTTQEANLKKFWPR